MVLVAAKINGYIVQVPCIGCDSIFTKESIAEKLSSGYCARYICTKCGGHFRTKVGRNNVFVSCGERGEHHNDIRDALCDIERWIMSG